MSWYEIDILINYIFNDIFAALIWIDKLTKKYWVNYMSRVAGEQIYN
jgi:hypothetical protein